MLILNNIVSAILSTIFKGFVGTVVHFFVMGQIYTAILWHLRPAISGLGALFFPTNSVSADQLAYLVQLLIWALFAVLQVWGTIKAYNMYRRTSKAA